MRLKFTVAAVAVLLSASVATAQQPAPNSPFPQRLPPGTFVPRQPLTVTPSAPSTPDTTVPFNGTLTCRPYAIRIIPANPNIDRKMIIGQRSGDSVNDASRDVPIVPLTCK